MNRWYCDTSTYLILSERYVLWNIQKLNDIPWHSHFPSYSIIFQCSRIWFNYLATSGLAFHFFEGCGGKWVETSSESMRQWLEKSNMISGSPKIETGPKYLKYHCSYAAFLISSALFWRPVIRLMDSWNRRLPKSMQARISWHSHFQDTSRASKPNQHGLLVWFWIYVSTRVGSFQNHPVQL